LQQEEEVAYTEICYIRHSNEDQAQSCHDGSAIFNRTNYGKRQYGVISGHIMP